MAEKKRITIHLPELDGNNGKCLEYPSNAPRRCIITLETSKAYRGGTESDAHVGWADSKGFTQMELGIGGGGDFSRVYAKLSGPVTQKKIDALHAATFTPAFIESIKAEVRTYYALRNSPENQRREAQRRENANAMGAAVKELTDTGIDTSTALRMCNID